MCAAPAGISAPCIPPSAPSWTPAFLLEQVKSLESLSRALSLEVLDLRLARGRALDSRTLAGHARNLLGYMLSAYCLFKCGIPSHLHSIRANAWKEPCS